MPEIGLSRSMIFRWIIYDSPRMISNPSFLCNLCFRSYHYIDGKKIGTFSAVRYWDCPLFKDTFDSIVGDQDTEDEDEMWSEWYSSFVIFYVCDFSFCPWIKTSPCIRYLRGLIWKNSRYCKMYAHRSHTKYRNTVYVLYLLLFVPVFGSSDVLSWSCIIVEFFLRYSR